MWCLSEYLISGEPDKQTMNNELEETPLTYYNCAISYNLIGSGMIIIILR